MSKLGMVVAVGLIASGSIAYSQRNPSPSCSDERTIASVIKILSEQFHIPGTLSLRNIRTETGGMFSRSYTCGADVDGITGVFTLGSTRFNAVSYTSSMTDDGNQHYVTAQIVPTKM